MTNCTSFETPDFALRSRRTGSFSCMPTTTFHGFTGSSVCFSQERRHAVFKNASLQTNFMSVSVLDIKFKLRRLSSVPAVLQARLRPLQEVFDISKYFWPFTLLMRASGVKRHRDLIAWHRKVC